MRIEFDKLTVVLAPFAPDVMLALVARAGSFGPLSGNLTAGREAAAVTAGKRPHASGGLSRGCRSFPPATE